MILILKLLPSQKKIFRFNFVYFSNTDQFSSYFTEQNISLPLSKEEKINKAVFNLNLTKSTISNILNSKKDNLSQKQQNLETLETRFRQDVLVNRYQLQRSANDLALKLDNLFFNCKTYSELHPLRLKAKTDPNYIEKKDIRLSKEKRITLIKLFNWIKRIEKLEDSVGLTFIMMINEQVSLALNFELQKNKDKILSEKNLKLRKNLANEIVSTAYELKVISFKKTSFIFHMQHEIIKNMRMTSTEYLNLCKKQIEKNKEKFGKAITDDNFTFEQKVEEVEADMSWEPTGTTLLQWITDFFLTQNICTEERLPDSEFLYKTELEEEISSYDSDNLEDPELTDIDAEKEAYSAIKTRGIVDSEGKKN